MSRLVSGPGSGLGSGAPRPVTAVVCGNPRPASRTLDAGLHLARELTGAAPDLVVDLAPLGPALLDPDPGAQVARLVGEVAAADLVVVCSPTYKATYTGLLKVFLDRFAPSYGTGLTGLAVPLMLGGSPHHALAPEWALRPLLSEIGATTPVPGLFVLDAEHADPAAYDDWLVRARPVVAALLDHLTRPRDPSREGALA